VQPSYLIHLAKYFDGILYVLAVQMLLRLAITVDRFCFLRRSLMGSGRIRQEPLGYGRLDRHNLDSLVAHAKGLPEEEGFQRMAATHASHVRVAALANSLEESIYILAPLLGLLGTIFGMFHAYHALTERVAPTQVTGGIADAFVATTSVLFIVIVSPLNFNGFNNQVRQVIQQLDFMKIMLLDRVDGQPMHHTDGTVKDAAPANRAVAVAGIL